MAALVGLPDFVPVGFLLMASSSRMAAGET